MDCKYLVGNFPTSSSSRPSLSLDPLKNVLKQKTLVIHLREAIDPLNDEGYQNTGVLQEGASVEDE